MGGEGGRGRSGEALVVKRIIETWNFHYFCIGEGGWGDAVSFSPIESCAPQGLLIPLSHMARKALSDMFGV